MNSIEKLKIKDLIEIVLKEVRKDLGVYAQERFGKIETIDDFFKLEKHFLKILKEYKELNSVIQIDFFT